MKKKIISGMLSAALVVTSAYGITYCFRNDAIASARFEASSVLTKDKIETLVREKLGLSSDFKLTSQSMGWESRNGKQNWSLNFTSSNDVTYLVSADAENGDIISFDYWLGGNDSRVISVKRDVAKKAAMDIIEKLQPEKVKTLVEATKDNNFDIYDNIAFSNGSDYSFVFLQKLNGELVPDNYFVVRVSGDNAKVTSYKMNWNDSSYNSQKLMSEEDAIKVFKANDLLKLKYVAFYDDKETTKNKTTIYPVYKFSNDTSGKINAINGKIIRDDDIYQSRDLIRYGMPGANGALQDSAKAKSDSTGGKLETVPETGATSKEKASELILNKIKEFYSGKDIKLNYARYYTNEGRGIWEVCFNDKENNFNVYASIDAFFSKILRFSFDGGDITAFKKDKNSADNVEVLKRVENFIPDIKNSSEDNYPMKVLSSKDGVFTIKGIRKINNIDFDANSINVTYDGKKGIVTSYNYTWTDVVPVVNDKLISKDTANNLFYDKVGISKYLVKLKDKEKFAKENVEVPLKELVPVYSANESHFYCIDAKTGKYLTSDGKEYTGEDNYKDEFKDINDSKYKDQIEFMNQMNKLCVSSDNFKPEDKLLKKDAIKWISLLAVSKYSDPVEMKKRFSNNADLNYGDLDKNDPYYQFINNAWKSGIFDKEGDLFKGDTIVTKADVTKWIINALGFKRVAANNRIYKNPYLDAAKMDTALTGYVALSDLYNVFGTSGKDVEFNPNQEFTRGEFVSLLYNFLLYNSNN